MPSKQTRQPYAGSTLVHCRRLWPSSIQHWTVLSVGGGVSPEYKLTPIQCLLNFGPALPVLGRIHSALVSTSCWRYQHDALNQSWGNVGPLSVTPAHIQRGAKHDTVTQYWANVGSVSRRWANISPTLGQRLVFDCLHDRKPGEKRMGDRHRLSRQR